MEKVNYYLIDASILPEVYSKVMKTKQLLFSGEAGSVSEAVRLAGVSRSAYYKYKDKIFEYSEQSEDTITFHAMLEDNAGVLSAVMNELYWAGTNVLCVNQRVPVNSIAGVSITVQCNDGQHTAIAILEKIRSISGVVSAEIQ